MFERYTEKARRVIFFARYEASQFGSPTIESEHILLGLLREEKALANRFLRAHASIEAIRNEIEQHSGVREKVATSVDLPLANDCKRVLAYSAEEAEQFGHRHIGTEHLLLGILREENCFAAKRLSARGVQLVSVREELRRAPHNVADPAISQAARPPANSSTLLRISQQLAKMQQEIIRELAPVQVQQAEIARRVRTIRIWLSVVIIGLVLSGITAFPLQSETGLLVRVGASLNLPQHAPSLNAWLVRVASALADTNARYPLLAYGTDWLAFAHLVIAAAFIGPWIDPVRNKWFITWGIICCAGVPLLAFIAGPIRGIPFYWRCIDSSFGVFCVAALIVLYKKIQRLERLTPLPSR